MQTRLAAIDGLRGVAILMVVLLHLWQVAGRPALAVGPLALSAVIGCGQLGVMLFFAISGFCLYYPVAAGKPFGAGNFFLRRAVRILPAYVLACLVWLPLWAHSPENPAGWAGWPWHLGSHLLFVHSLSAATNISLTGSLWSLGTEVHFYLAFPLLAWLLRRRPLATAALGTLASVAFAAWAARTWPYEEAVLLGRSLPGQLSSFLPGMYAAHLVARAADRRLPWAGPLCWLLLLAIPYTGSHLHRGLGWGWTDGLYAPLWVAVLAGAVVSGSRSLAWRPLALLGITSYSIYLYNRLMDWLPGWLYPGLPAGSAAWWLLTFTLLVAAGAAGYWLVERPFLGWRSRLRRAPQPAAAPPEREVAVL